MASWQQVGALKRVGVEEEEEEEGGCSGSS